MVTYNLLHCDGFEGGFGLSGSGSSGEGRFRRGVCAEDVVDVDGGHLLRCDDVGCGWCCCRGGRCRLQLPGNYRVKMANIKQKHNENFA